MFLQVLQKNKQKLSKQKKKYISYIGLENKNTIFLSPKVPGDIEDLISSMKTNKASVPNSIPTSTKPN